MNVRPKFSHRSLLTILLLAAFLIPSSTLRAQSFLDWLKKDKEKMKEFGEKGKVTPEENPESKPEVKPKESPRTEPKEEPKEEPEKKPVAPKTVEKPEERPVREEAEWLVMIYAAGDNDLDKSVASAILKMETVGSSDKVKIVALMDRAQDAPWSTTRRFLVNDPRIQQGKPSWDPSLPTCQDMGELNMGDAKTLKDFVTWSQTTYRSKRTMLVFLTHGGGWRESFDRAVGESAGEGPGLALLSRGIAWDDSNDHDFLESREVHEALQGRKGLTIIGADADHMAMIEVAYEWRGLAEYLVTSQHTIPGDGWPYGTILYALSQNPTMPTEQFASEIVRLYSQIHVGKKDVTHSAVRLDKIAPLAQAIDAVSKGMMAHLKTQKTLPPEFRKFFATESLPGNPFLDLDAMLETIANSADFAESLRGNAQVTRQRFQQAIVANRSTSPTTRGLSIYAGFTRNAPDYKAGIIQFAEDTQWDECLTALVPLFKEAPKAAVTKGKADWLLMVYIAGDNNLDSAAISDILEMETVGSSDRLKIAVLMDREKGQEWTTARRFLVKGAAELGGKHSWDPALDTCEDLGELNMGDPETLSGFVTWALQSYPAQKTALIIWNHGGGWRDAATKAAGSVATARGIEPVGGPAYNVLSRGIAWDDSSGHDFLESREIRTALQPFPPFSIIACDACLMAMIEVAYEWRDQAAYLVASEELEPNDGWPYDTILKALAENPAIAPEELSKQIVELYGKSYGLLQRTTQSATDLAKLPQLVKAMDTLGAALVAFAKEGGRIPDDFTDVAGFPRGDPEFLDLGALLKKIAGESKYDTNVRTAAQGAQAALSQCVVANYSHVLCKGTGLSIFPGGGNDATDYNADIIQFAKDTQWDEFLKAMLWQKSASARVTPPQRPDRWAVLIGVEDYEDPKINKLNYSMDDVESIKKALIEDNGYDPDKVIVLGNKDATISKVRATLGSELPSKVAEQDMVMIYFSGHGSAEVSARARSEDGTEKYMLLADTRIDNLYGTAIPMSELGRMFSRIKANKVLFLMDSCYSGATLLRGGPNPDRLTDDYLARLTASEGTVVLTASKANEKSLESGSLKHGVFTYYLLEVLKGMADADGDGVTTLVEMVGHVVQNVTKTAKGLGGTQHPVLKSDVTGEFPVAVGRAPTQ